MRLHSDTASLSETNDIKHTVLKSRFDVLRTKVFGFSMVIRNFTVVPKQQFILRLFELLYYAKMMLQPSKSYLAEAFLVPVFMGIIGSSRLFR